MLKAVISPLHKAVKLAAKLHRGQDREGPDPLPYITHPLQVLSLVRHKAGIKDEDVLCAAVLHDLVEMGGASADEIDKRFGPKVAALVTELTRREPTAEEAAGLSRDELWQLRSDILLDEIRDMSPQAKAIKLADRLSNLEEGLATRKGKKLDRYVRQSFLILEIVPREVSPSLWDGIREALDEALAPKSNPG
jgi:guanosine-3',5'-bis(diphosphate) 3'-pyrophosphohydrolase